MVDYTILSKKGIYPADSSMTGINLNEVIIGATGSGKTFSTVVPRIINTYNSSLIIPISKPYVYELTANLLRERGYDIEYISFINPSKSTVSYDPLDYITCDEDTMTLARNIVCGTNEQSLSTDPYWSDAGTALVASLIQLEILNAKYQKKKPCFKNVITLMSNVADEESFKGLSFTSPLSRCFIEAESLCPGNQASRLWATFSGLAARTASCVYSEANVRISSFVTDTLYKSMTSHPTLDIHKIGRQRVALFVETTTQITALERFTNLLYSDIFRVLFADANKETNFCLPMRVHVIFDDFACGSKIEDFAKQISIFRAAGISVTLLLQSESQLTSMYGHADAKTIINNCDTYVYFGNSDYETCLSISYRLNRPVSKVMCAPLNQVIVFRRGSSPLVDERYPILDDAEFIRLNKLLNTRKEKDYEDNSK